MIFGSKSSKHSKKNYKLTVEWVSALTFFLVALMVGVFGVLSDGNDPQFFFTGNELTGFHQVTRVIDGDTIEVLIDGEIEVVRLIGIDTPELKHPVKAVECYAVEASRYMAKLVAGKYVRLEADPTQDDRDRYDRLLRYVFLEDGTFINKAMIAGGYAYQYTYSGKAYKYQTEFKKAEADSWRRREGVWSSECSGTN